MVTYRFFSTLHTVCRDKSVVQLIWIQFLGTSLWFSYFKHILWGQVWFIFFTYSLWDRSAVNLLWAQFMRQIFISIIVHTTLEWLTCGRKLQNWSWESFRDSKPYTPQVWYFYKASKRIFFKYQKLELESSEKKTGVISATKTGSNWIGVP